MHVNDFILIMLIQYMILWALIIHMKVKTRNSDGSSVRGGPWKSNRKYRIKTEPDWEKLIKLYSLKLHQILKTRYPRTESCGPFIPYTKLIKCFKTIHWWFCRSLWWCIWDRWYIALWDGYVCNAWFWLVATLCNPIFAKIYNRQEERFGCTQLCWCQIFNWACSFW